MANEAVDQITTAAAITAKPIIIVADNGLPTQSEISPNLPTTSKPPVQQKKTPAVSTNPAALSIESSPHAFAQPKTGWQLIVSDIEIEQEIVSAKSRIRISTY